MHRRLFHRTHRSYNVALLGDSQWHVWNQYLKVGVCDPFFMYLEDMEDRACYCVFDLYLLISFQYIEIIAGLLRIIIGSYSRGAVVIVVVSCDGCEYDGVFSGFICETRTHTHTHQCSLKCIYIYIIY